MDEHKIDIKAAKVVGKRKRYGHGFLFLGWAGAAGEH